ncbi:5-formyltetrahydrofolate cyclo-ligase [Gammaproteobacteria bacterium]|jgi:5-formyltetrahydrofolate cyclo-ligase|nr:5-formyltetrahydrofolate cyclo-ligase [Gammaproteobacteria bacterium]|tara:strand:+ start:540 stop:1133 length:594 start_codon:yes stop_codon:yes gene_type:complete
MKEIRNIIKEKRSQLSEKELHLTSKAITERIRSFKFPKELTKIGIYYAVNNEVDVHPLCKILWQESKRVYLPIVEKKKLLFGEYRDTSNLKNNRFKIPEPIVGIESQISAFELDLIFMPLVAFDPMGNRIGMGGGFYDRTLDNKQLDNDLKKPILVGVAYEFQKQNKIQPNSWDIPLDMIFTESKIYHSDIDRDVSE